MFRLSPPKYRGGLGNFRVFFDLPIGIAIACHYLYAIIVDIHMREIVALCPCYPYTFG